MSLPTSRLSVVLVASSLHYLYEPLSRCVRTSAGPIRVSLLARLHVIRSLPVLECVGVCTLEHKSLSTRCACLCVLLPARSTRSMLATRRAPVEKTVSFYNQCRRWTKKQVCVCSFKCTHHTKITLYKEGSHQHNEK